MLNVRNSLYGELYLVLINFLQSTESIEIGKPEKKIKLNFGLYLAFCKHTRCLFLFLDPKIDECKLFYYFSRSCLGLCSNVCHNLKSNYT